MLLAKNGQAGQSVRRFTLRTMINVTKLVGGLSQPACYLSEQEIARLEE